MDRGRYRRSPYVITKINMMREAITTGRRKKDDRDDALGAKTGCRLA